VETAGAGSVDLLPWPREHERIDIGSYQADSTRAKKVLGWQPHVSLRDGLRHTIDFYREHLSWYL
jgi:nucleoside-diphosphate-sugar epimerase